MGQTSWEYDDDPPTPFLTIGAFYSPVTLNPASPLYQMESPLKTESHIEIFPNDTISLTVGINIHFEAKITSIGNDSGKGALYTLSVKYDASDDPVFTLTQSILETTGCYDTEWHSWKTVVYQNTVRVYCDDKLVHTHGRTDLQEAWEFDNDDESPFLAIGAHYSQNQSVWYSRCDMIFQNLKIFTC